MFVSKQYPAYLCFLKIEQTYYNKIKMKEKQKQKVSLYLLLWNFLDYFKRNTYIIM